ncbi:bestrophin family ion channel [Chlorogloeopsis sp. ULAP01]|uniref:bestrophin family protein n=1 Tax=Chlorogloeopsis sp. ULAP01 TaxID=3056483 RepID=UPI0025AAFF82|nr:bestrophin family ion channel [Chlorogloeopsis sp. ULAP01]MDM9384775.1 bestrophin family ion channel [Chlorogloeopsis sp. ULAP01]
MKFDKHNWLQLALQLQGSVLPAVLPRIFLCSGFAFCISLNHYYGFDLSEQIFSSVTTNVAYNLVLGLLLVFRTNTAYDRYWEGRKIWGSIVINSLNLGRKIKLAIAETEKVEQENKIAALRLLGAFAVATKLHLREQADIHELEAFLTQSQYLQLQEVKNIPLKISFWIGAYLKQQQVRNCLSIYELVPMNQALDAMVEAFIGCDRIKKTPIPLAYGIYLKRLLLIYCFVLPFQLVHDVSWWTIPIVTLISFILLGIEEIGNQIENPFSNGANDLPIDEICNTVVNNIEDLIKSEPVTISTLV